MSSTLLRPTAPDEAIRSSVDDIEYQGAGLLFDGPDTARIVVAVATLAVQPVDINAPADVGVVVDKQGLVPTETLANPLPASPLSTAPCT